MVAACLVLAAAILPSGPTFDAVPHQYLPVERDKDPDSGPAVLGQVGPTPVGFGPAEQSTQLQATLAVIRQHKNSRLLYWHPLEAATWSRKGVLAFAESATRMPPAGLTWMLLYCRHPALEIFLVTVSLHGSAHLGC